MADGSIKNLRIVVHAVMGEAGGRKFIGAVMDVTSFKEAQVSIPIDLAAMF